MKTTTRLFFLFTALLLTRCNSNKFDKETFSTAGDTQSVTGLAVDSVILAKRAGINFKVKDVRQAVRDIIRTAQSMDGLVTSRKMQSIENETKTLKVADDSVQVITSYVVKAHLIVRIPAYNMDNFIEHVSDSALFIHEIDIETEDKSLPYFALQMKQKNAGRLPDTSRHMSDAVALVKSRNAAVDQEIAAKRILADQKYSTIQLDFFQNALVKKETMADNNLSGYTLPFTTNMKNAFFSGWSYFVSFIIGVTHFWMFILLAFGISMGYRYYKLRKADS